jgi:hypothetical protein
MILAARKSNLKFTGLSISDEVKLKMPIWKHPTANKVLYQSACRRDSATCLRLNHRVQLVEEALIIARRRTTVLRKPHRVNPSGIGCKNCGCPGCYQDRTLLNCKHPGQCIETAKMLIDSIPPKWNPTSRNLNLSDELALTDEEQQGNNSPIQPDIAMTFDPNIVLSNLENGFRIFATEDSPNEISTTRYKTPLKEEPDLKTIFLHARILHPGEFEPTIEVVMSTETDGAPPRLVLSLTFDVSGIPLTFASALLGGVIFILQNTESIYLFLSAPHPIF